MQVGWKSKSSVLLSTVLQESRHPGRSSHAKEIEAFRKSDAASSFRHTIRGLSGWQIWHFNSWQQHYSSDSKPAEIDGVCTHLLCVVEKGKARQSTEAILTLSPATIIASFFFLQFIFMCKLYLQRPAEGEQPVLWVMNATPLQEQQMVLILELTV